jgi:murein DD-endopeptidase MepM/ murein hydrolase activator NlpD
VVAGAGAVVAGTAGTPAGAAGGSVTAGARSQDVVEVFLADAPAGQADTPSSPTLQTKRLKVQRSVRVSRDLSRLRAAREAKLARAWQLPVAAGTYRLSATFGECSYLWSRCHTGLDFAAPPGTPVLSVAAGSVVEASYAGAYGNRVIVALADGTHVWYCHLTSFTVGVGDAVSAGAPVGSVGSTGNTTGPHLHLEVHPAGGDDESDAIDPAAFLAEHGDRP